MELTDGSILLRPPIDDDAGAVAAAVQASLAELAPWMPWATEAYDEAAGLEWVRGTYAAGTKYPFVILDSDGEFVGTCGVETISEVNQFGNLGYWIRTDRYGRGIATRASRLLADYMHQETDLHRLEVIMSVENEPSRRVAERMGAVYEGILRDRLVLHGRAHDVHSFSVLPGDLDVQR